jgi:hypothetical protein
MDWLLIDVRLAQDFHIIGTGLTLELETDLHQIGTGLGMH